MHAVLMQYIRNNLIKRMMNGRDCCKELGRCPRVQAYSYVKACC
jgi:hypothetical protein